MTTPVVDNLHILRVLLLASMRHEFTEGPLYATIVESLVILDDGMPDGIGREALMQSVEDFCDQCCAAARDSGSTMPESLWKEWEDRLGVDREVFERWYINFVQLSPMWG